ncbi:hypothetical protein TRICI_005159 [Trichomonascus ciferrii]|uniref:Ribosomal protein/NADH dehydrogenase domain-containing protein n=1 Tax=Trichomonascus ciferrii TaxID=44093 RepID=A0A642V2F1_9ASCO|nr:hypothetical protein TRICI_005159 [Trichomonascus ciferrii]
MSTKIARQINRLNAIANGPGAIRLPATVNSLHVAYRLKHSSYDDGAKRFSKSTLPQVQFHNPHVSISVEKYETSDRTPELTVKFQDGTQQVLDVKKKTAQDILTNLMQTTNSEPVPEAEIPIIRLAEF